jgi:hypothetical protein
MTWRYRFANLLSDVDVAEVELSDVTMDQRIIQPGSLKATIAVPNSDVATQVRKLVPDPTTGVPQTICHVYRGADLWGSYIIWTSKVSIGAKGAVSVAIQGATLESWLYHRIVDADVAYAATDQIAIARALIVNAQTGWAPWTDAANLGISTLDGTSGVLRDQAYKLSEATSAGQRLEELANVEGGFEYRVVTYIEPTTGIRERLWIWGYPTLGSDEPTHVYSSPGNLVTLDISSDSTTAGTAFWARGDTDQTDLTDDSQPAITQAPLMRVDLLAAGWPWLDSVSDHQGVTDVSVLDAYASWYAATTGGVVRTYSASVRLPEDTTEGAYFSPNRLGDRVRLVAVNPWFPPDANGSPTFSITPRVVGVSMTPADRSNGGQDIQELIFADDAADASVTQGA